MCDKRDLDNQDLTDIRIILPYRQGMAWVKLITNDMTVQQE
jgi:hypothetical protein